MLPKPKNDEYKLLSKPNSAVIWDQKIRAEDSNFIPQVGRSDFPNYFENFTSSYDLSFNHIPKCFKGHIKRSLRFRLDRYEPNDDYIPSYGNLTNYGLKECKREEWACDVPDPRKNLSTVYKSTFTPPRNEDYARERNAIPLKNSSIMNKINLMGVSLKLRGRPMCIVDTLQGGSSAECRPKQLNPITWEN